MKQRLASAALVLVLLLCASESAFADTAAATTMKLEAVTGTVTVKNASGVAQTVRDGMRLYNGYSLSTAAASEAYISLDSSKAVKLGPSGKVQVKQAGKQLEISVSAGELFFNVTAPLKTDESLNVRTSTMVTGVRGSFGWVRPGETGLMHGSVILTRPGGGPAATLSSGQLSRADGKPVAITAADVPTLVAREMRDNPELLAQVQRDAPSVDVAELMDTLDARIAQEREAEQAAQTALEARQAAGTPAKTNSNTNSGRGSSNRSRSSSSGTSAYTPQVPDVPYTPVTPDNPDTPQVPDKPDTPEVPDNPDTPQVPDNPDTPEVPDNPDTPQVPDTPDTPDVPDTPDTPEVPDNPDTPEVPDNPDAPEVPDKPDTPQVPDNPD
ncbi:MAG: FecR domain-containing protein, partial [Oscillibacter sp.]|nr:FecR domain-containing protein [Oscillibacter sp.]